jgi:hypothetical protein
MNLRCGLKPLSITLIFGRLCGPTVPSAGNFLNDQKVTKKSSETYGSEPPFIHPGFLVGLRHPGLLTANGVYASEADRCFSSKKRSVALLHPWSRIDSSYVNSE